MSNPGSSPDYLVACLLPRTPLSASAAYAYFYVDGDNSPGVATTCTVASYNFSGGLLGAQTFTMGGAWYDQLFYLPAPQVYVWAYTVLTCTLPPNNTGHLRGVTSLGG